MPPSGHCAWSRLAARITCSVAQTQAGNERPLRFELKETSGRRYPSLREILAQGDYAAVSKNPDVVQAYMGTP